MYERVAVALRRGGVEIAGAISGGNLERVLSPYGAHPQGLEAEAKILRGTGGRSEVENVVDRAGIEGLADVPLLELKAGLIGKMGQILSVAG
jgi:hypothetical protein